MKHIVLTEHNLDGRSEYTTASYPGLGAYLIGDGRVAFVVPTAAGPMLSVIEGIPVSEIAVSIEGGGGYGVDAHRLLDQLIELARIGGAR